MPSPASILEQLTLIANQALWVSVAWHVVLLLAFAALALGWRPQKRWAGVALAMPIGSVALVAWLFASPFNGLFFTCLLIVTLVLAIRLPSAPVSLAPPWSRGFGVALLGFGWIYPHFLGGLPPGTYLTAAPIGLIPCPTLSIVIGLALLMGNLGSRPLWAVLGVTGLFYGIFGAFRLGVALDGVLMLGALVLLVRCFVPAAPRHASHRALPGEAAV